MLVKQLKTEILRLLERLCGFVILLGIVIVGDITSA